MGDKWVIYKGYVAQAEFFNIHLIHTELYMGNVNCEDKKIAPILICKLGDRKCASQVLNLDYYSYTFGIFTELFLYHSELVT